MKVGESDGTNLVWFRVALVLAVSPPLIWAVRLGLGGWEPSWDVATTVVRIRDVFSSNPPLTGMAAHPSTTGTAPYSFPGPLHLYLLAVPVRVLGATWGALLGTAVINSAMGGAAIWLVRRRLGVWWGVVAAVFVASLFWSLGGAALVDPTPLAMGVVAVFTFLVAGWSVLDGDGPALVIFAFVASYLFLDQLVFAILVPMIGVTCLGWVIVRRLSGRRHPGVSQNHTWPRWFGAAVALTVVCWIPSLADQFVTSGGNLGRLWHALVSGETIGHRADMFAPTLVSALGVVASVTVLPPWWLPPTFTTPPFDLFGATAPWPVITGFGTIVGGLVVWGLVRAHRRGDRTVIAGLVIAVVGWIAYVITAWRNPDPWGYLPRYLQGLWPLSTFMWLLLGAALLRGRPGVASVPRLHPRVSTGFAGAALAGVVLLAVLHAPSDAVRPESQSSPLAAEVRRTVATADLGPGPVLVKSAPRTRALLPSVLLGLQDEGVPFRLDRPFDIEQFGASRSDTSKVTSVLKIGPADTDEAPDGRLATLTTEPLVSPERFEVLDGHVQRWSASAAEIVSNPAYQIDPDERARLDAALTEIGEGAADADSTLADSLEFWDIVRREVDDDGHSVVDAPEVSDDDLRLWASEQIRRHDETVVLVVTPVP